MQSCARYEEALWEAAESGHVPDALQDHCRACPPCREALRETQAMVAGLAALHILPHPAPRPEVAPYRPRRLSFALGLAAAAVVLVMLCWRLLPPRQVVHLPPAPPRITPHMRRTPASPAPKPLVIKPQPPPRYVMAAVPPRKASRRHMRHRSITLHVPASVPAPPPELVPILGTVASLPPNAIPFETDRVVPLSEAPEVANDVYQAMETVGDGNTAAFPKIYTKLGP